MRKEIHYHARRDSELFAEQEDVGVLIEAFAIHRNDQFIHASRFQQCSNFVAAEDTDEFQSPNILTFDRSSKLICRALIADHSHIAYIEDAVLPDFDQNDSIRNKEDVIDDQRGQNDDAIRGIRIHKRNQDRYQEPRETYRLGKPSNLVERGQRRFGINAKQGQQQSPGWKDDCKMPKVSLNGHDRMSLQFKQGTKAVGQKETRRRQSQISQPKVDGKNPFSLINHAGRENERALQI